MALSPAELIAKYAPAEKTYRIRVTDNPEDDWIARSVSSVQELTRQTRKANELVKLSQGGNAPKEWKQFFPIDSELATVVATIVDVIVEPVVKPLDILAMSRDAGALVMLIFVAIQTRQQIDIPDGEQEILDDAKNESGREGTTDITSPSAETTSDDTPSAGTPTTGDTPPSS